MLEDRVILKETQAFCVSDLSGEIQAGNELGFGLYRNDTRFLSTFELRLNGQLPILLNAGTDRAFVATFQLVNPHLEGIPRQSLSLRRTRFLHRGLHERIGIQNCNRFAVSLELELRLEADFVDIFEVRGYRPLPRRGTQEPVQVVETGLRLGYLGLDGVRRESEIVIHPTPHLAPGRATLQLQLKPQETFVLLIDVLPLIGDETPDPDFDFERSLSALNHIYQGWNDSCTRFQTDNELLDRGLLWRNLEDLRILCDDLPTGLYPTAGVPWYAVPFGRDALITSLQALALNPDLARGTLRFLAQHQGRQVDTYREEEPGKILHEIRFGELANLHQIPHTPYYGTVDATPLFLVLLVELIDWTGDLDLLSGLLPNVLAALEWIDRFGDTDGDGLLEYVRRSELGLANQGWKDSQDSLTHRSGQPAEPPAALVEVQGYAYHARSGLARIFRSLKRTAEAEKLEASARSLRTLFNQRFWMPEESFYAQALDRTKAQVQAVSSNAGHCLWSGIVDRRRARAVVERLLEKDMFSGWGVRTLSSTTPSYNPMSYHNGSVWPHDNSIIVAGMRRYGFRKQPELVARSVLEASMHFSDHRLPELFCGFNRDGRFGSGPGEYLVSCSPQAWGAAALFHLLQTLAGVDVAALSRRVRIDPLETCLYSRLRVEGMQVGDGLLDFTVTQGKGRPRVKVDRRPKGLRLELPA